MRRKTFLTAFPGAILFPTLLLAADFTGRVVGISDGDTISVLHEGRAEKIRLNGIDCPEKRQAFGQRAKQFTSKLTFGQDVTVKTFGHDKYRRTVGDVILPDGRIRNRELMKAGLAWWYEKYSKDRTMRPFRNKHEWLSGNCGSIPIPFRPGDRTLSNGITSGTNQISALLH